MIMDIVNELHAMYYNVESESDERICQEAIKEIQTLRAEVASSDVLVEALRGAENIVKSAILLEGEIEPHISESTYELNGCLGENAANISVRGRGVLNKITEALATYDKLSEVKHDTK